jgi:hypothetical protein
MRHVQEYYCGIFPTDNMANMRFSINFFTSIGLGGITDRQRELYKQVCALPHPLCPLVEVWRGWRLHELCACGHC